MLHMFYLIADQPPQTEGGAPFWVQLFPFIAIAIMFFWMTSRAQRREQQTRQAMISGLKKNDKVITSGGIIGVVANIKEKEDEVALKVDENSNVRIRVTKSSIVRVISAEEAAKEPKTEG
jgi:preprotein translocase subunit YajC